MENSSDMMFRNAGAKYLAESEFGAPGGHFRASLIRLRHQLLVGVSVRSAGLKADRVVHTVSMSARCQANRLSFPRRPPGAALSAHWYALITRLSRWQPALKNSQ